MARRLVAVGVRRVRMRANVGEAAVEVVLVARRVRARDGGTGWCAFLGVLLSAARLVTCRVGAQPVGAALVGRTVEGFGAVEGFLAARGEWQRVVVADGRFVTVGLVAWKTCRVLGFFRSGHGTLDLNAPWACRSRHWSERARHVVDVDGDSEVVKGCADVLSLCEWLAKLVVRGVVPRLQLVSAQRLVAEHIDTCIPAQALGPSVWELRHDGRLL